MIELFRVSRLAWAVKIPSLTLTEHFDSVEKASEYLESVNVKDEEIDLALVAMAANDHSHARFNAENGLFISSDMDKLSQ